MEEYGQFWAMKMCKDKSVRASTSHVIGTLNVECLCPLHKMTRNAPGRLLSFDKCNLLDAVRAFAPTAVFIPAPGHIEYFTILYDLSWIYALLLYWILFHSCAHYNRPLLECWFLILIDTLRVQLHCLIAVINIS